MIKLQIKEFYRKKIEEKKWQHCFVYGLRTYLLHLIENVLQDHFLYSRGQDGLLEQKCVLGVEKSAQKW